MVRFLLISGVVLGFLLAGCWAAWEMLQEDIPWEDESSHDGWERSQTPRG